MRAANAAPSLHCFLAVSGAGKTKALMDIGRKHLSVYFDFNVKTDFVANVNRVLSSNSQDYEAKIEYVIHLFFAVRLLGVMLLKLHDYKATNEQLLLVQLCYS
jgi:hypothetical protein